MFTVEELRDIKNENEKKIYYGNIEMEHTKNEIYELKKQIEELEKLKKDGQKKIETSQALILKIQKMLLQKKQL